MTRTERATHAKNSIIRYFLYDRNFVCAMHETAIYAGIADVIGISDTGKVYEVEIKVDWADLKSELDAIREVLAVQLKTKHDKTKPKYEKHLLYLKGKETLGEYKMSRYNSEYAKYYQNSHDHEIARAIVPNKFFFAVPIELREKAIEAIGELPYGIMTLSGSVYKKAKDLHTEKVDFNLHITLLRRLSRINYEQR